MCFVLEGWSERIKVYVGICNLLSLVIVIEWRYVSDKQIIWNLWSINFFFEKKQFRIVMDRYIVEISVTDWKIFEL